MTQAQLLVSKARAFWDIPSAEAATFTLLPSVLAKGPLFSSLLHRAKTLRPQYIANCSPMLPFLEYILGLQEPGEPCPNILEPALKDFLGLCLPKGIQRHNVDSQAQRQLFSTGRLGHNCMRCLLQRLFIVKEAVAAGKRKGSGFHLPLSDSVLKLSVPGGIVAFHCLLLS